MGWLDWLDDNDEQKMLPSGPEASLLLDRKLPEQISARTATNRTERDETARSGLDAIGSPVCSFIRAPAWMRVTVCVYSNTISKYLLSNKPLTRSRQDCSSGYFDRLFVDQQCYRCLSSCCEPVHKIGRLTKRRRKHPGRHLWHYLRARQSHFVVLSRDQMRTDRPAAGASECCSKSEQVFAAPVPALLLDKNESD